MELNGETDLELLALTEPGFEVVGEPFAAMQMFATSTGLCVYSVLAAYGDHLGLGLERLRLRVRWDYVESPFRIGRIAFDVVWPELPPGRIEAATRAAQQCTLHNTLTHPPEIQTRVARH